MKSERLTGNDLALALKQAIKCRDEHLRIAAVNGGDLYTLAKFTGDVPDELLPERQVEEMLEAVGEHDAAELARMRAIANDAFQEAESFHG